jgi:protein TonB
VLRGVGGECDDEALRVVKSMPKWQPATFKGKPVRSKYVIPINYKLQ